MNRQNPTPAYDPLAKFRDPPEEGADIAEELPDDGAGYDFEADLERRSAAQGSKKG